MTAPVTDRAVLIPPAPAPQPTLSDPAAVALAVAIGAGAWFHVAVPLALGISIVVVAVVVRRPWVLVAAGLVLASSLGARSVAGLDPATSGPFRGPVTLVADPSETPYGTRVDVRVGGRRLELDASGAAAGTVGRALAGERLMVEGSTRPRPPDAPWLVPRHVVGRLSVDHAEAIDGGVAPWRAANRFRRLLDRGAEAMNEPAHSLYGGFVLGDDRGQSPAVVDDFRAAGLTHLLVVSGQNVAFVLVLVSPATNRFGLWGRWTATLVVIASFALLTRFEPSVLRASTMAALAVTATLAGRPSGSLRTLALAVGALVLVDPLLVRSVGFQLSVAASAGIALLGPPIVARLRGPRWWREALGVTLAAQLGVAPVLVPAFGGMPVVSIAANVLTVPVAGLVTTWGLPAGVVAGLGGPAVARVVHLPTQLLIGWVAGVARIAAGVPLGEIGPAGLVVAAVGGAVLLWVRNPRSPARLVRLLGLAALVGAVFAPAITLHTAPPRQPTGHAEVYRSSGTTVVVLDGRTSAGVLLEELRRAGVRRIDLLVADVEPDRALLDALRHRWAIGATVEAGDLRAGVVRLGALTVGIDADEAVVVARVPETDR